MQHTALRLICRECGKVMGEIEVGAIEAGAVVMCMECMQKIDRLIYLQQTNQRIVEEAVGRVGEN